MDNLWLSRSPTLCLQGCTRKTSSPVRERERERERRRERERERTEEGEREKERCRICPELFLFLKGMMGAFAPFNYLVLI
jgi:hypothetical protein